MNPAAADAASIKIEYTPIIMQSLPDISSTCFLSVEIYRLFTPVSAGYFRRCITHHCRQSLPTHSISALPTVAIGTLTALLPPQFGVPLYKKSRTKHTVRPVIIHNTVFCELGASPFWRQSLSEYCPHRNCSLCRGCLLCCVCLDTWLRVIGFPRVCLFTNFILFL